MADSISQQSGRDNTSKFITDQKKGKGDNHSSVMTVDSEGFSKYMRSEQNVNSVQTNFGEPEVPGQLRQNNQQEEGKKQGAFKRMVNWVDRKLCSGTQEAQNPQQNQEQPLQRQLTPSQDMER